MKPAKKDPHQTTNAVMQFVKRRDTTVHDCAVALGIGRTTAWRAMTTLLNLKLVHVPRMMKSPEGRNDSAVYSWGDGPDVSKKLNRSIRQNATICDPDPVPYVELPFWHQRVFSKQPAPPC